MADLAMIVGHAERHDIAIDWDRVLDVARAARCVPVVGAALAMARRAGLDAPVGLFPLPAAGSAATRCVGCCRSPGRCANAT